MDSQIKFAAWRCKFAGSKEAKKPRAACSPKQNIVVAFKI